MLDIALNFQEFAIYLDWRVLVFPGALMVIAGLLLWLCGSVKHKWFAAFFMGLTGLVLAGYFSLNLVAMLICVLGGVFLGGIIDKKAIVVSAGITAFLVAIALVYCLGLQKMPVANQFQSGVSEKMNLADSMEIMESYLNFSILESRQYFKSLYDKNLLIVCGAGAVFVLIGFLIPKIITAVLCSLWGVVLIGNGMVWLVLFKGTKIVSRVSDNIMLYLYIAGVMMIFGFLIQIMLCPAIFKKRKKKDKEGGDKK